MQKQNIKGKNTSNKHLDVITKLKSIITSFKEESIGKRYFESIKAAVIFLPVLILSISIFLMIDLNIINEDLILSRILIFLAKGLIIFYISTLIWYLVTPLKANIFLNRKDVNYTYVFTVIGLRIALFYGVASAVNF